MDSQYRRLVSTLPERFAKEYLSHLLPSLTKIRGRLEEKHAGRSAGKIIKFEVDMALALSAKDFRWGRALGHNLRTKCAQRREKSRPLGRSLQIVRKLRNKVGKVTNTKSASNVCKSNRTHPTFSNEKTTSRNNRWKQKYRLRLVMAHQKLNMKHKIRGLNKIKQKSDMDGRIKALASLVPGGNTMETSILFEECAGYIKCLKMQVQILQQLTRTHQDCNMQESNLL